MVGWILMLEWFFQIPVVLELIILVAAAIGAAFTIKKYVYGPIRVHFRKINAGMDTLLGYPAVTDPGSGREIQAATPPLAQRVYDLEQTNERVVRAIERIADLQEQVLAQHRRSDSMVEDWNTWRKQHEEEAHQREQRLLEFSTWQAEQASMWELVRTQLAIEK